MKNRNGDPSQIDGLPVIYPAARPDNFGSGREQGGETQSQAQNVSFFALLKTGKQNGNKTE